MEPDLAKAYRRAVYCVWLAERELALRVGDYDSEAMAWLINHAGMRRGGHIVTPCNPGSERLATEANRQRLQAFRQRLQDDRIRWLPSVNRDPDGAWPDEPGALLIDCDEDHAKRIGIDFGQNALLAFSASQPPNLIDLI